MIKGTKEKGIMSKIIKILEFIAMILIIVVSAIIIIQRISNNEKSFLGYRIFKVETGSMIPEYNIGDVILARETSVDNINIGDDIVFRGKKGAVKGKIVTHRVIEKEVEDGVLVIRTKGIANRTKDPDLYEDQIIGLVQGKLYIITFITNLLMNRYFIYFIFIIPLTIYIFFNEVHGKEKKVRKEIRVRNRKAKEKEEKIAEKENRKKEKKLNKNTSVKNSEKIESKSNLIVTKKENQKLMKTTDKKNKRRKNS